MFFARFPTHSSLVPSGNVTNPFTWTPYARTPRSDAAARSTRNNGGTPYPIVTGKISSRQPVMTPLSLSASSAGRSASVRLSGVSNSRAKTTVPLASRSSVPDPLAPNSSSANHG